MADQDAMWDGLLVGLRKDYLRQSRDLSNYVLVAGDVGESKEVGLYANRLDLPLRQPACADRHDPAPGAQELPWVAHICQAPT